MGNIADVVGGGTPDTLNADYFGGDIPWLTPADLSGYTAKHISSGARNITPEGLDNSGARIIPAGSVLFSSRAPIGYVALAATPICTNQGFKSFVLASGLCPDFFYYYLQHAKPLAIKLASGTTFLEISGKNAARIPVPIAPTEEQSRISDALDELLSDLDAGVVSLERVRQKLKLYRASLLKAAVDGTLTTEWRTQHPNTEPSSELLKRILAERRRRWEEDQGAKFKARGQESPKDWKAKYKDPVPPVTLALPPLPDRWCWVSFDQFGETQGGLQKSPARGPVKDHYPYLRVANVHRGSLDLSKIHRFELSPEELRRLRLEPGDILIVEGNGSRTEIGRCALWQGEIADCVHQNHIIRVRPLTGVLPKYADTYLNSPLGQLAIQTVASSTSGLYTLNISKIELLPLALPPIEEQAAIIGVVEDQLSVIAHLEADLDSRVKAAQGLRQAVLRHAFSGNLVPQDPNDEPASELLKRIAAERDARARENATAKTKAKRPARRRNA
jgi:type I restriction enzyme S subunit